MRRIIAFSVLAASAFAGTAEAQDVRYNFDRDANFASYRTYRWVVIQGAPPPVSDLVDRQVKATVDAELAKKGLMVSDSEAADLYLAYQGGVGTEKEFTAYSTGWGYGPGWGYRGWYGTGGGMVRGEISTLYVGQLSLDFYVPMARTLVWRGTASKTLDPKANPEKQQNNLEKAVAKLLKNFPPPPEKK
jgi:hypothetical protein